MAGSDRVAPLQEAHDGERACAEVDAAVGVDEVELRAGHGDEGLLGGRQWRRSVLVLFRLREEVLDELVGVDGGVQQGRGGGGRGGEEGGVEVRGGGGQVARRAREAAAWETTAGWLGARV
jgi:hypothetical protein